MPLLRYFTTFLFLALSIFLFPDCTNAQLAISGGGTGASNASDAITNLGLPIVSVIDYGAAGNGATDDTTAINNAMSACVSKAVPNNGCILYFPQAYTSQPASQCNPS
jgi:polygalacturonase